MILSVKSKTQLKKNSIELLVNEIFFSIQGESTLVGIPTVFIRFTGCPLRCKYCDTAYAFNEGKKMSIDHIISEVSQYKTKYITVTGGEPLAQRGCVKLLDRLYSEGFQVSLETSGAISLEKVDERIIKIMDIKTPCSGEESKNRFTNLSYLTKKDEIKFVICNRHDYEWAISLLDKYNMTNICKILFSAEHKSLEPKILAEWVLKDKLEVRLQLQLHKYIWGDEKGK